MSWKPLWPWSTPGALSKPVKCCAVRRRPSRLVQDLETRLGARLLHRTTRRLSLTEAGVITLPRAKQILGTWEADAMVSSATRRVADRCESMPPSPFGILHLAPLGAFLAFHPDVELDVTLNDRVVDLLDEGCDVAIRIAQLADSTLVSRRLASTRLVLCASPEYLALHGMPTTLADLAQHWVIGYSYAPQGDTLTMVAPDGPHSVRTQPKFHSNNGETSGRRPGPSRYRATTRFLISSDLAAGRLLRILPELEGEELGIYAVYPTPSTCRARCEPWSIF